MWRNFRLTKLTSHLYKQPVFYLVLCRSVIKNVFQKLPDALAQVSGNRLLQIEFIDTRHSLLILIFQ